MKIEDLSVLKCPSCSSDFDLKANHTDPEGSVTKGLLKCRKCCGEYEILNGIPMLVASVKDVQHRGVQEMFNETPYGLVGASDAMKNRDKISIKTLNTSPWYIREDVVRNKKVLDAGCGGGHLYTELFLLGADVMGVDITANSLNKIRDMFMNEGMKPKLVNGNLETLPLKENTFDIVTCMGVIHHTPDTVQALKNLAGVLKKDGSLHIMLYHKHSVWNYVKVILRTGCKRSKLFSKMIFKLTPLWMGETATQSNRETVFRDNMVNPITKSFSAKELKMMADGAGLKIEFLDRYELPEMYILGRGIYQSRLLRWYEKRFGWFLYAKLKKA